LRLQTLVLDRFGPFEHYELSFPTKDDLCLLLTGRNNEGKSTIISAMRLLHAGTKVAKRGKPVYRQPLLKQDFEHLEPRRLVHNYQGGIASIEGVFSNNARLTVEVDADANLLYCSHSKNVPTDVSRIFGFIPPLGQLAEEETLISNVGHLRKSLNTSLAPHHLRNHFHHFLDATQFELVRRIVNDTWEEVSLLSWKHDIATGKLYCTYEENGIDREICWAGQGLQVWLQIVTHLVRLMNTSILVLDEPEIFLHPQKQNDLVRTLREYYNGNIIIATHSVELMRHVDVSHIIHVRKVQSKPKIKSTKDVRFMEQVRSHVGSTFNLIASQFDEADVLIFTEDADDFYIVSRLAEAFGIKRTAFNIPMHGFSQFVKCVWFKEAYEKFFGKAVDYSVLLDRDYYPEEYLKEVAKDLEADGLRAIFTPGKEIENLLLDEKVLLALAGNRSKELKQFLQQLFESNYNDCLGSLLKLHEDFLPEKKKDPKTVLMKYKPAFDAAWNDPDRRIAEIGGKEVLSKTRKFFADNTNTRLSTKLLIDTMANSSAKKKHLKDFVSGIYQVDNP